MDQQLREVKFKAPRNINKEVLKQQVKDEITKEKAAY